MHEKKVRVERDDYFCFGEIIDDDFAIDRIGTDRVPSMPFRVGKSFQNCLQLRDQRRRPDCISENMDASASI